MERIGDAAAQLLIGARVLTADQGARLVPWLLGDEDLELQQLLETEDRIAKCTGDAELVPCAESSVPGLRPRWFDPEKDADRWVPALRMCTRHNRAKQTPDTALWEEQLARDLPRAPLAPVIEAHLRENDPEANVTAKAVQERRDKIVEAFARLRGAYQSIKYKPWAEAAGLPGRDLRRILDRAGLPEKPRAGKKHFGRYVIVPILAYIFGGSAVAESSTRQIPKYTLSAEFSWLLERWRRWAKADHLRRFLAGLAGASCGHRPALGAA